MFPKSFLQNCLDTKGEVSKCCCSKWGTWEDGGLTNAGSSPVLLIVQAMPLQVIRYMLNFQFVRIHIQYPHIITKQLLSHNLLGAEKRSSIWDKMATIRQIYLCTE